jgi:hypothetical protein
MAPLSNPLRLAFDLFVRSSRRRGNRLDPESPDNWLSLDYVHDRVIAQLEAQSNTWDIIDGRLRFILGVVGIVFAAVLGLQRGASPIPYWAGIFAILGVIAFFIAGLFAVYGYSITVFDMPPEPAALRREYLTTDPKETKLVVIDTIIEAYNRNQSVLSEKMTAFWTAFRLTVLATGLLGAAVVVQVASQTKGLGQ